jgi:omega-6 fatty acid desaturase (delta-12 desaturase)
MINDYDWDRREHLAGTAVWKTVTRFQTPVLWRSVWQIVNTFVPYVTLWYLIYISVAISWWLVLPLAILAGGFMVRLFIIFHDCGHGSFFKSRKANDVIGFVTGVLTFTPYHHWRWEHAIHHATSGDLDRRGTGDIWTLTVQEYLDSSRWKRLSYRLGRNPLVLFVLAPLFMFLVKNRVSKTGANPRERHSVYWTNLAVLGMWLALGSLFGFKAFLLIQLVLMMVAGSVGVWLFYLQHQFGEVYWERRGEWDYIDAALRGSSFYKLPRILQWFSGNIGFHHLHHLSPRIPNYYLEQCHEANPIFKKIPPITVLSSLKSLRLRLWDEQHHRLVGYAYLRTLHRQSVEFAS